MYFKVWFTNTQKRPTAIIKYRNGEPTNLMNFSLNSGERFLAIKLVAETKKEVLQKLKFIEIKWNN